MSAAESRPVVLWFAGASWDDVRGTDRRLVEELADIASVLWCDPPRSAWHYARGELSQPCDLVASNITRIRIRALPWSSKPGIREFTSWQTGRVVGDVLRGLGLQADLQVVASPRQAFIPEAGGTRILYQTDDWLDGADLMNLSARWMARTIGRNGRRADILAAVSEVLIDDVVTAHPETSSTRRAVLANGCYPVPASTVPVDREPVAGLVGQLNERLDLDMVEAVVEHDIPLRVVGPRTDRERAFGKRLDRLLSAPAVEYVGAVPAEEVPKHLARMGAGITPYTSSRFNRASFPLKTLEYLAAGLAVVSTDLPAVRWLDTHHITVSAEGIAFAAATRNALDARHDSVSERARRTFAGNHTWSQRARDLLSLA
jgi:teichuronic acid biosynthesis glycosyltransferase TuaH